MTDTAKRISRRRLLESGGRLSAEDFAMLEDMRVCRFITSQQIMRLHFAPLIPHHHRAAIRGANRHLFRLKELGLTAHLERRIGGVRAGSGANVWYLTAAGYKLLRLHEQSGDDKLTSWPRKRHHEPTPHFLEHRLAVTEVYVRLHETAEKNKQFVQGRLADGAVRLDLVQLEPDCWRSFSGIGGGRQYLKPDLYAVTAIKDDSGEYEDHWFIEVDLATESPATVIRKCEQYVRYYQSGGEQRVSGLFPRVVWLTPTDKRKQSIACHIADRFTEGLARLFVVGRLDQLEELVSGGDVTDSGNEDEAIAKNVEKSAKSKGKKLKKAP